jgi:hypothetical protein
VWEYRTWGTAEHALTPPVIGWRAAMVHQVSAMPSSSTQLLEDSA